jgi:hypothetical protein
MRSRLPVFPTFEVSEDRVQEAVFTTTIAGPELEELIAAAVASKMWPHGHEAAVVKWKVFMRCQTTATEGTQYIAEVMIVEDLRPAAMNRPQADDATRSA